MHAGESLIEGHALGSLRLVRDVVASCMDPDDVRPGLLVQEYEEDSSDRAAWRTVCPLTDAHFMVDNAPARWVRASHKLRDMIERDEAVTLAVELAALKH
ncbi:MAG: hypothetical protein L6Q69_17650 [Zoogloea sp.]|nr:hypothetical protein [Zoogloea sp.]